MTGLEYPFVPKSNSKLRAGQFWSVPLSDGRFGCGRVMLPTIRISARVGFVAGLMDWVGDTPPTADAIAGTGVLDQGHAPVKTILQTRGAILGHRDLAEDSLQPDTDPESTWGFVFIQARAEYLFASR